MEWEVKIIETETGAVERSIPCSGDRAAERVDRGVLVNLNHDKYHTETAQRAAAKQGGRSD